MEIPDDRGDESFADDLNMWPGIVSGRVALLLRSTEIQPAAAPICPLISLRGGFACLEARVSAWWSRATWSSGTSRACLTVRVSVCWSRVTWSARTPSRWGVPRSASESMVGWCDVGVAPWCKCLCCVAVVDMDALHEVYVWWGLVTWTFSPLPRNVLVL